MNLLSSTGIPFIIFARVSFFPFLSYNSTKIDKSKKWTLKKCSLVSERSGLGFVPYRNGRPRLYRNKWLSNNCLGWFGHDPCGATVSLAISRLSNTFMRTVTDIIPFAYDVLQLLRAQTLLEHKKINFDVRKALATKQ